MRSQRLPLAGGSGTVIAFGSSMLTAGASRIGATAARGRIPELMLPRASVGKEADAVGELAVGMRRGRGPDRRFSGAQKRVGRAFFADRRRQRRLAPRALCFGRDFAFAQCSIPRFD